MVCMKKNCALFVIPLVALLLSSCNQSSSRKKKSEKSSEQSSITSGAPVSSGENPSSGEEPISVTSLEPTSTTILPPSPGPEGYEECDEKYLDGDSYGLLNALRSYTSSGHSGSYGDLWTTYKTAYIRNDGKMFDYYSNITNFRPGTDQAGSYSKEGDVYNREHSIPKSWWGGSESNQGADPYIVVPTDGYVNNKRSNFSFGMVKTAEYSSANGFCKLGSSDPAWSTTSMKVFEPDDSLKGDFARIYFYAVARYSNSYNWTEDSGHNSDLIFSGHNDDKFGFTDYAIKLLSYWSNLDPVSDWEKTITGRIEPIHGCRNPFIDHPEYANVLWGKNSNYTMYNH